MAKGKDPEAPKPPSRKRSAVPDITEKLPQLPALGDDDDEATRTDPGPAATMRPAPPAPAPVPAAEPPAPPAPARRPTAAAQPAAKASLAPLPPKPPAPPRVPAATLGDDEDEHEPTMVADQLSPHFTGAKAGLKPVFEAVLEATRRLGQGVKVLPGPRYVVLMRNKEFAILEETPQGDRVELGLVLPGRPPTRRLNRARHFDWGERFTHYVTLRYKTDVDSEVRSWLTDACWTGG